VDVVRVMECLFHIASTEHWEHDHVLRFRIKLLWEIDQLFSWGYTMLYLSNAR